MDKIAVPDFIQRSFAALMKLPAASRVEFNPQRLKLGAKCEYKKSVFMKEQPGVLCKKLS